MEEGFYEIEAGLSSRDLQASCMVYADVESPYSYGENTSVKVLMEHDELKAVLHQFFTEAGLPWTAILTSYEYTAQDTIGMILEQVHCAEGDREVLYGRMRGVRKR